MFWLSRLFRFFRPRSRVLVAGSVMSVLACGLFATMFSVREDITSMMPARPEGLAEQFALLRDAPLVQGLTITVGGPEPGRAAALVANALRSPEIPTVLFGASKAFSPSLLSGLCASAPGLMDENAMAALPDFVSENAIRQALRRNADMLISPRGLVLRELLAMDPLGICTSSLLGIASSVQGNGPRMDAGHILSADGGHALILAEPAASMADSAGASAVMERVQASLSILPEGTEAFVVGGHRHTQENAAVIKEDVQRILPISFMFLLVAFGVFVRTRQGLMIILLPTASLAVAAACTGLLYGSLSGIVLGFGSVVLGITADYAIHVYYALRSGEDIADSLSRVARPLLFGAMTTLAAFVAFLSSSIPCIVQMTWFAIFGICTALLLALVVMPHCLRPAGATIGRVATGGNVRIARRPLAVLWVLLGLALCGLLYTVPINGDIRALAYVSPENAVAEARTREIWGGLREQALFAIRGDSLEQALEKNDQVWSELGQLTAGTGFDRGQITSLAPILPSLRTQRLRHAAWKGFWTQYRPETLAHIEQMAPESGFSPQAFLPFQHWVTTEPVMLVPASLAGFGLELPLRLTRQSGESSLVYSMIRTEAAGPELEAVLGRHGGVFVSGQTFREALGAATRADLLRFGGLSLLAIVAMSAWVLRSPVRIGLTLLPVAAGLCCVLAAFRLTGMSLNIFHAMALPLVMSLSVDYGIFMAAHLEGTLDQTSRKGVLLSGITTLSGFGVLLLARHPALFSLGLTVTLGLSVALLVALGLLPRLVTQGEGAQNA